MMWNCGSRKEERKEEGRRKKDPDFQSAEIIIGARYLITNQKVLFIVDKGVRILVQRTGCTYRQL